MANLRGYGLVALLMLLSHFSGLAQYPLAIQAVDKDQPFLQQKLGLVTSFKNREACTDYVYNLPGLLHARGYMSAAVDSMRFDSTGASVRLFVGDVYRWAYIDTRSIDPTLLNAAGWNGQHFVHRPLDFTQLRHRQQLLMNWLENNGYPFATVGLDSIALTGNGEVSARLKVDKGLPYKIDSIRVIGTAKISPYFLQHYLNIPSGSPYRKDRLDAISRKLLELPYVQEQRPWDLSMLLSGSTVNLYLAPRKSSQINALVGFLPSSDPLKGSKLIVTGEATVNLKNALGNGETIGLNWQQLQPGSPRLNLLFQQPYLFNSPFGLNAAFDLFKKDSSYINVNLQLGVLYALSANHTGTVFIQDMNTNVLNVDTLSVIATRTLPKEADINAVSLGLSYEFNNTDYRFNPRRGNECLFVGSAGTKTIKQNPRILKLKDPADPGFSFGSLYDTVKLHSYEFMVKLAAAHYFPLTRASTLKLAFNGGVFSSPHTYRNELFLIGGYRLLRGFDEQSILAAQYTVGTLEYRYLVGLNSFLFGFLDAGWAKNTVPGYGLDNVYLGTGLGLAFETKAGIFNISYAMGKRNDTQFNFHDAKIHLGYVSFF